MVSVRVTYYYLVLTFLLVVSLTPPSLLPLSFSLLLSPFLPLSLALWSSLFLFLVDFSHLASMNSQFYLLSTERSPGCFWIFLPVLTLEISPNYHTHKTPSFVSSFSGTTVLCYLLPNVWKSSFFPNCLRDTACTFHTLDILLSILFFRFIHVFTLTYDSIPFISE